MLKIDLQQVKATQKRFKKIKVFTFELLLSSLNCSIRSGRTVLNRWKTYNSYNHNGRYYVLPDIPIFDENGLWKYHDVGFSRHGTLKDTIIYLVNNSSSGLSAQQIDEKLDISAHSFLSHLRGVPHLHREKYDDVFVYFSKKNKKYLEQLKCRQTESTLFKTNLISDMDAVKILVAVIKQKGITVEELARLPELKQRKYSHALLRAFFTRHGLEKKTLKSQR